MKLVYDLAFVDDITHMAVKVVYCPAETMWADVLNKPKQGASIRLDRSHLVNVPIDYDNNIDRTKTHPKLLAFKNVGKSDMPAKIKLVQIRARPVLYHRSVLGKPRIAVTRGGLNLQRVLNPRARYSIAGSHGDKIII